MDERTPEKWIPIWRKIRDGHQNLLLIAPLISELYYKNAPSFGKKRVKKKIDWVKKLHRADVHKLDYNDAINAGEIKVNYTRYGLSLADCFLLAVGKRFGAMIVTTDLQIKNVARKMKANVSFIPFEECY